MPSTNDVYNLVNTALSKIAALDTKVSTRFTAVDTKLAALQQSVSALQPAPTPTPTPVPTPIPTPTPTPSPLTYVRRHAWGDAGSTTALRALVQGQGFDGLDRGIVSYSADKWAMYCPQIVGTRTSPQIGVIHMWSPGVRLESNWTMEEFMLSDPWQLGTGIDTPAYKLGGEMWADTVDNQGRTTLELTRQDLQINIEIPGTPTVFAKVGTDADLPRGKKIKVIRCFDKLSATTARMGLWIGVDGAQPTQRMIGPIGGAVVQDKYLHVTAPRIPLIGGTYFGMNSNNAHPFNQGIWRYVAEIVDGKLFTDPWGVRGK